jgi:hypothetical protein
MREDDSWSDIASLALISIASLTSAFAGYQASLWNSKMILNFHDSIITESESAEHSTAALQKSSLDAQVFMQYVAARTSGNHQLSAFILKRFRLEARPAMTAWLATNPFSNPSAPATFFEMPEYQLRDKFDAQSYSRASQEAAKRMEFANHSSDSHVRVVVFLASVLFLAGISTKFERKHVRYSAFGISAALLIFSICFLSTLPMLHP